MQAPSAGVAVETVDGVRGMLVKMGLAQPSSRAFVAGVTAAGLLYIAGKPNAAFREEDGSMKPFSLISSELDTTTTHFLLLPSAVAIAAFLFT